MSSSTGSGIVRRKGACVKCRHRKTRCDGAQPCSQCKKTNLLCSYSPPTSVSKSQDALSFKSHPSRRRLSQEENWMLQTWNLAPTIPIQPEASDVTGLSFHTLMTSPAQPETSTELDRTENGDPTRSSDGTDNLKIVPPFDSHYLLDHDVQHWPDPEWSSFWAVHMCRDFSTLSPTPAIPNHIRNTTLRSIAQNISSRLSRKNAEQCSLELGSSFPEWVQLGESPLDDLEQILSYFDAFFEDCYSVPGFINRQDAYKLLADMTLKSDFLEPWVPIFINSALAIGSRTFSKRSGSSASGDLTKKSMQYFRVAVDCWKRVHGDPACLGKLQAVSTMALYVSKGCDVALARSLLCEAVSLIQFLMPTYGEHSTSMSNTEERSYFKGAFWLIYSLEKPFTMRFGGHSMIDDEMILFPPPIRTRPEEWPRLEFDWILLQYRYARLCSLIVKTLYGRSALKLTQSDTMANINKLHNALETWRFSIPEGYRPLHAAQKRPAGQYSTCIIADLQLRYAEAGFAIHRWAVVCPKSLCVNVEMAYSSSLQYCIQLVEGLLNGTRLLEQETCSLNWTHLNIPLLAAVIMFIVAVKAESRGEHFAPLGIAIGCFGWLKRRMTSTPLPRILEEVNQLSSMVNELLYEQDNQMIQPNSATPEANQIWVR